YPRARGLDCGAASSSYSQGARDPTSDAPATARQGPGRNATAAAGREHAGGVAKHNAANREAAAVHRSQAGNAAGKVRPMKAPVRPGAARREAAAPTRAARKGTVPRTATPGASRSRDPRRRVRRMPALVPTTGTRDATILAEPPASAAVAAGDGASVPTAETRRRFLKTSSAMKLDRRAGPTGTTRTKLTGKIGRRGAGAAATGRSVTRRSLLRTLH